MLSLTVLTATLSFYMLQRVDTVLMVANAKLSVYVLSLTVLTATLSFKHVATVLTVANPMLSANVLQLTVITTTLSFNVLTWF